MSDIKSIENKLSELIPSSVSQQGLNRMDEAIDRLSQVGEVDAMSADAAEPRLRWYDMGSWRIAAVFALLVVSSVGLATKMGLLEISLKSTSAVPAEATLIEQPEAPQIMKAVVSSTKAAENDFQQLEGLVMAHEFELAEHGMVVEKLDDAFYAQLPEIRPGSGLLLKAIEPAGAADEAGLLPLDIICKVDDQWVINAEQLRALLSMPHNEGQVSVTYYREGKREDITIPVEPAATMSLKAKDINSAASISDSGGKATLSYREGKPWLRVESAKGIETYNGYISEDEDLAKVDPVWRSRIHLLKQSIEKSSEIQQRHRTRYVPNSKSGFVDSDKQ